MKNLSTQEILELLRTLEHRGVSREEVLRAICSDVEKHKEIGEFLVLRALRDEKDLPTAPSGDVSSVSRYVISAEKNRRTAGYYRDYIKSWESEDLGWKITHWYDFGSEE